MLKLLSDSECMACSVIITASVHVHLIVALLLTPRPCSDTALFDVRMMRLPFHACSGTMASCGRPHRLCLTASGGLQAAERPQDGSTGQPHRFAPVPKDQELTQASHSSAAQPQG